ncbi:hypothetical protein NDU88_005968, partial [Pleurodeles waltl]
MFSFLGSSNGFTPISVTNWKETESTKNRMNEVLVSLDFLHRRQGKKDKTEPGKK